MLYLYQLSVKSDILFPTYVNCLTLLWVFEVTDNFEGREKGFNERERERETERDVDRETERWGTEIRRDRIIGV